MARKKCGFICSRRSTSSKRRIVEAAELARVQARFAALAQDAQRLEPDRQVLADPLAIEGVRHAAQLDLAVQRLVRDAQQGPVRHPETEPGGGDAPPFPVDPRR